MGQLLSQQMSGYQKSMAEVQQTNMLKTQERMRRLMIAQQVAIQRERFPWLASGFSLLVGGIAALNIQRGFKPGYLAPVIFGGMLLSYQWDMAYGSKTERINKHLDQILKEEHWFVPLMPTDEEIENDKKK